MTHDEHDTVRSPQCGHVVQGYFDHVAIDCEHDMTDEEIAALLAAQEDTDT